jgi:hypothetical protein
MNDGWTKQWASNVCDAGVMLNNLNGARVLGCVGVWCV